MPARLAIPRPADAKASAPEAKTMVEPPTVNAIRMVFGVGKGHDDPPTNETFRPTYVVTIPIFSLGGLDPDGVYEFDALSLFAMIARRSLRRVWGLRFELEFSQGPEGLGLADVYVTAPFEADEASLHVLGKTGQGVTSPGGGRVVSVATSLVHDPKKASTLCGLYTVQIRDTDPDDSDKPHVASLARGVNVDLTRFEFEG